MNTIIAIFIGGGLGSIARFGVSKLVTSNFQQINPVGTLIANILSTAILGLVLFLYAEKLSMSDTLKAFIVIGFCGGFSTFSTFSYEIFELFKTGQHLYAIANVLISMLLGVGVLFVLAKTLS